jgi:hypothetical protein
MGYSYVQCHRGALYAADRSLLAVIVVAAFATSA